MDGDEKPVAMVSMVARMLGCLALLKPLQEHLDAQPPFLIIFMSHLWQLFKKNRETKSTILLGCRRKLVNG